MAGMTAYVNFAGRYDQLIAQSKVAGATAGGNVAAGFTGALKKWAAPAAVAGMAIGAFKLGETFKQSYNTIRVGTGATGAALQQLEKDFKAVAATRPTGFNVTAQAITELNKRLGITGKPLQTLTANVLRLSGLTKTDLAMNIESITRVFGDWGISVEQQTAKLNALFRASQATGPSVDRISQLMVKFGSPLRQLGFTFDQTAALVGKFEKEGVNTELVLGSLRIALGKLARTGEPAKETLERVTDQIKNAGSVSEANALALELFGARAGPDMAAAIREGRFELGSLFDTVANGSETIEQAAKDTSTLSGKMATLKNKVLVGLEPIATRVYSAMNEGMARLVPVAGTAATAVGEVFAALFSNQTLDDGPFGATSPLILGLLWTRAAILNVVSAIQDRLEPVWERVTGFLKRNAATAWSALAGAIGVVVGPLAIGGLLSSLGWLWGALTGIVSALATPVVLVAALGGAFVVAYREIEPFRDAVNDVASAVWDRLVGAFDWVTGTGVPAMVDAWGQVTAAFRGEGGDGIFARVGSGARSVLGWITDTALPGVRDRWDEVSAAFSAGEGEGLYGGLGSMTRRVLDDVGGRFIDLRDDVIGVYDNVRSIDWGKAWENITSGASDLWSRFGNVEGLRDAVEGLDWSDVETAVTDGLGRVGETALSKWGERIWDRLWDKVASFEVGDGVWSSVVDAFGSLADRAQPVLDGLSDMWDSLRSLASPVVDLFKALWEALKPVGELLLPLLKPLGFALGAIAVVLHKAFVFQLKAAAAVISWVADKVLPGLTWIIANVVTPAIRTWVDVVKWAWSGIAAGATWLWNTVLYPVFTALWGFITNILVPVFQRIWDVASTVFTAVWGAISAAWGFIQPILGAVVGFIRDQLVTRFEALQWVVGVVWAAIQGAISTAWDVIKPKFEAVVSFVEETLIPIWDRIAGAVGGAFDRVPEAIRNGLRIAGNIIAAFLRGAASVADLIGLDSAVGDPLERAAKRADSWGEGPAGSTPAGRPVAGAYAAGGLLRGGIAGKDSLLIRAMPGEIVQRVASVRKWGTSALLDLNAGKVPNGWSIPGFADGGVVGWVKDRLAEASQPLRDIAGEGLARLPFSVPEGEGLLGFAGGVARNMREKVIEWVKGKVDGMGALVPSVVGGAGAAAASGWIRQAMALTGVPEWWFPHLMHRAKLESGFNPRAINLWDSNAAKGTPSMGLMQTIMSTFRAHMLPGLGDIWNPIHNAVAAIRYILSRYGSILNTNPNTGYAAGGLVVHGRTFDAGGVLEPGWNLVRNMTGAKEPLVPPAAAAPLVHIDRYEQRDSTDADLLAQKVRLAQLTAVM